MYARPRTLLSVEPEWRRKEQRRRGPLTRASAAFDAHGPFSLRVREDRLERLIAVQPPDRVGDQRRQVDDLEVGR